MLRIAAQLRPASQHESGKRTRARALNVLIKCGGAGLVWKLAAPVGPRARPLFEDRLGRPCPSLPVPARFGPSGPFRAFRRVRPGLARPFPLHRCADCFQGPGPRPAPADAGWNLQKPRQAPHGAPRACLPAPPHRPHRPRQAFEPVPGPNAGRGAARREAGPIFILPKRRGSALAGMVWRSFVPHGFRPTGSGRRGSARTGRGTTSTPAQKGA